MYNFMKWTYYAVFYDRTDSQSMHVYDLFLGRFEEQTFIEVGDREMDGIYSNWSKEEFLEARIA